MIKYINANQDELVFEKDIKLVEINGTGAENVEIQTQKAPFQDGATLIDTLLNEREISLEVVLLGENRQDIYEKRRMVSNIFNSKLGVGKLVWEQEDITVASKAVSRGVEFLGGESLGGYQRCVINLYAPDPFWQDEEEKNVQMASMISMFEFPLRLSTQMGTAGDKRIIENEGDAPAPVEIVFNGPAVKPRVENETTGQFIEVDRELEGGDRLKINTAFGNKSVVIERENGDIESAFSYINLNSEFWQLEVGENVLTYSAEQGADDATVNVYWKNRYIGV